jgi:pimeloyl-ACP methyl ester carboxylesterase
MKRDDKTCSRPGGIFRNLALVVFSLGCAGCCAPGPIGSDCRPNVYIIRSTAGYFPNLADFEDRLLDEGVCPTVAHPKACPKVAERIIAGRNAGRLQGPVVIAGYAQGANQALWLARRLGESGVAVEKLVLLEASDCYSIPANVQSCFNVYKTQSWGDRFFPYFRGFALSADNPNTVVVNYDCREHNDGRYDADNYFTLSANPYVQELMVEEIMAAVEPAEVLPGWECEGMMPAATVTDASSVPEITFSDDEQASPVVEK